MIDSKLGLAIAAFATALAGCTPAQYEDAYNQVVQPLAPDTSTSRAQAASSTPVETRSATTTILATETSPSTETSEPVDFSQSGSSGAAADNNEKRFAEERDDNGGGGGGGGGGGAGGGSGGSWGG